MQQKTATGEAPKIVAQPANQTLPLGLNATFTIEVSGTPPFNIEWHKNGTSIAASSELTYKTPPTTMADNGASYYAVVENGYGTATSNAASLALTGRAPAAGDLRFQEVDAPSTVNGYLGDEGTNLSGPSSYGFGSATGTPLSVGPGCGGSGLTPYGCIWYINAFVLPTGVTGLSTNYVAGYFTDLTTQLLGISQQSGVITGIDVEPAHGAYGVSWITSSSSTGFEAIQGSVPPSGLQSAATEEGKMGRVITAVSYDSGQILYFSYAWSGDTTDSYESSIQSASFDDVGQVATNLASQGYIITAMGGEQTDGIIIVGTRLTGDTLARPVMVVQLGGDLNPLLNGGYAIVGTIYQTNGAGLVTSQTWIGER